MLYNPGVQDRHVGQGENQAQTLLEQNAKKALEAAGFKPESAHFIPEGRQHNIFDITFADGSAFIARFEKTPKGSRKDSQFNGPLSLERETNLMNLVREQGLPAPVVYGLYETEQGRFLIVEKMPGVHWSEHQANSNYSEGAYLKSLRLLGKDLAVAHSVRFKTFGDVVSKDQIEPANIYDFNSRVDLITKLRLERAQTSKALDQEELDQVTKYLGQESDRLADMLADNPQKPILVLTDLHPMNFFVDDQGKPSGFFDLEACQAGHPALEIYNLRTHVLNYFDGVSDEAEWEFLTGYEENGGRYNPQDPINKKIEHVLGIGYLVAAVTAYQNAKDGLRDTWSDQFKQILNNSMEKDEVDFPAISGVFGSKTKQPRFPTEP